MSVRLSISTIHSFIAVLPLHRGIVELQRISVIGSILCCWRAKSHSRQRRMWFSKGLVCTHHKLNPDNPLQHQTPVKDSRGQKSVQILWTPYCNSLFSVTTQPGLNKLLKLLIHCLNLSTPFSVVSILDGIRSPNTSCDFSFKSDLLAKKDATEQELPHPLCSVPSIKLEFLMVHGWEKGLQQEQNWMERSEGTEQCSLGLVVHRAGMRRSRTPSRLERETSGVCQLFLANGKVTSLLRCYQREGWTWCYRQLTHSLSCI